MSWQEDLSKRLNAEVSVYDGWRLIVEELVMNLDSLGLPWDLRACKERCGILAFYATYQLPNDKWRSKISDPNYVLTPIDEAVIKFDMTGNWDKAYATAYKLVNRAVERSKVTCEVCGQPGKLDKSDSWIKTLCESCIKAGRGRPRYRG